jgi:hypothetical protein
MIYLTFISAFLLSGIAGYYSIVGLALIFPGAFWPVVIMGSALEFSKLVTASWLYRHWKLAPLLLKTYLTIAVCILMLITSMGIFGFLSKAHIEHSVELGPIADKVAIYDERVSSIKQRIEENKRTIKTMDNSVDQVLSRSTSEESATKSVNIRKSQQKERTRLSNENLQLQKEIAQIQEEKAPIMASLRKTEADVGPIKYVAELIYGNADSGIIDKAVRLVIIIIMVVFDPLAVLLLIAANLTLTLGKKEEIKPEGWKQEWVPESESWPPYDPGFLDEEPKYELDDGPLTDEQITKIRQEANVDDNIAMDKFFDDGKKIAKAIDNNDGKLFGEVEKNTVEVEKENITNIEEPVAEDINQYESPAKQKVETHHVETHHAPGIYEEENVPFDHVKYK